jgi:hypothetical protein
MLKTVFLFFSLFFISMIDPGTSQNETGEKYLSDFNILVTSLQELHPCLYKNITKQEFNKQVKLVSERLQATTSRNQAIYIIQEFFYKLGNSHAGNISVYGDVGTQKALPMSFYIVNHELYIKEFPTDSSYNGTKIISIGNTDAVLLIDSLKIFFLRDGIRETMDPNLQCYFNNLYGAFCSQPDTFLINTEKGKLIVPALLRGTPLFEKIVLHNGKAYFGTDEERILTRKIENDYGYFRFNNFREKIRNVEIGKEYIFFVREMNEKNIPNMIIDLRDNNGGESDLSGQMASLLSDHPIRVFTNSYTTLKRKPTYLHLMNERFYYKTRFLISRKEDSLRKIYHFIDGKSIAPKRERYKGHIYILVGPFTQSASTLFCSFLSEQTNVTFVGEETNGAINFFWAGRFFSTSLPYLKTNFSFATQLLEFRNNSVKTEPVLPLVPDVKISYTIEDLIKKRDLEMEWVKADIGSRK